jgi:hypothetical protein
MFWGKTARQQKRIESSIKEAILWGNFTEAEEVLILDADEKRKCRYVPPIPKQSPGNEIYFPTDLETGEPHWKTAKSILKVEI